MGKCHNKYLIIKILLFAGEHDPRHEGEALLWLCSRRHRDFMCRNFYWYPNKLSGKFNGVCLSLRKQSKELESLIQAKFLFDHIRINGEKEVS